jgi:hypothetical protein
MPNPPRDHRNRHTTTYRCMPQRLARTACTNGLAFAASHRPCSCINPLHALHRSARPHLVRVWCAFPRPGGGVRPGFSLLAIGPLTGRTTGARSLDSLIMLHVWRAALLTTDTLYHSISIPR